MIVRTAAERLVIFALIVLDRQIIDAGDVPPHQTFCAELPILVSIACRAPAQNERLSTNRTANGRPASAPPSPSVNCSGVHRLSAAVAAFQ